ncbi:MAG: hypothetical protein K6G08_04480 [Prevotella sp.]|nr:hypothetical protein [Prevotella sp.]
MERLYRYLFLDIDGVLNTGHYSDYLIENGLCETDADGYLFAIEAVQNLERIIEATDAKIIITSTWRLDGDMQALWRNRNLAGEVIGVTPTLLREKAIGKIKAYYGHRGMEVEAWLQDNAIAPYKYAILDDEDDYLLHQAEHLILTDPMTGITEDIAEKVISLLE